MPLRSLRLWRASSVLLIAGGAMSVVGAPVFAFLAREPGSLLTVIAVLLDGLGVAGAGIALGRRLPACVLLMIAGGLLVVYAVVAALFRSVLSSAVGTAFGVVEGVVLVIAAVATMRRGRLRGAQRWILILPAAWTTLIFLARGLGWPGTTLLGFLFLATGLVWLRVRDESPRSPVAAPSI